jgi:hypothetical protein
MRLKIAGTIIFCVFITGYTYSQGMGHTHQHQKQQGQDEKKIPPEEMAKTEMDKLTTGLDLTKGEIPFVQKILEDYYKQRQSNIDKGSVNRDDMIALTLEKENNLKLVLTDDQWTKYQAIKTESRKNYQQRDSKE